MPHQRGEGQAVQRAGARAGTTQLKEAGQRDGTRIHHLRQLSLRRRRRRCGARPQL